MVLCNKYGLPEGSIEDMQKVLIEYFKDTPE